MTGGREIGIAGTRPPRQSASTRARLARSRVSCFVVTKGLAPPPELRSEAEARGVPLLATALDSTRFIKQLSAFLDERLAARVHLHSGLMDVFGLGVLIVGEGGLGKA